MNDTAVFSKSIDSCTTLTDTSLQEIQYRLISPSTSEDFIKTDESTVNSRGVSDIVDKDDTLNGILHSDEDSSFFNTEQFEVVSSSYVNLPSMSKLNDYKKIIAEVDTKYVDWIISELILNKYKLISVSLQSDTTRKVTDIITAVKLRGATTMHTRNGQCLNILGIEDNEFSNISKISLLSSEKADLRDRMLVELNKTIHKLKEEKDQLQDSFRSHCLKVVPSNTALSEERVHQAELHEQLKLQMDRGRDSLFSTHQILHQLTHLEVDSEKRLTDTTYSSLQAKAKYLNNSLSFLKHKMDQIVLADISYIKSVSSSGERLKTSLDSLNEKRKSLLKLLEKYERKANLSKKFTDTVAEYARTKRQLQHKLQTLKLLNEADTSFL